ncbi:hypothetical protein KSP39_PZI024258 [Platanthera zijinensis]|uniref:Transmembrane 9 superfamily member n=1 Tax=Platanthera zijinensis TaxID=2320716 RepID=A0AAP0FU42_9ASPA
MLPPRSVTWFALILFFVSSPSHGFYLPGSYPHKYQIGDPLSVKVNSLTSIDTEIPFGYYSLPFCRPSEGIKDSAENLGELLMGDRIENSPYRFRMFTNESDLLLCHTDPLSSDDLSLLKKRIDEMYQVNVLLENLPAIRYTTKEDLVLRWTGYPIGVRVGDSHFIFNHLKFTVLVHKYEEPATVTAASANSPGVGGTAAGEPGYMVVGFEVIPCSYQHDTDSVKNVKMYDKYPTKIQCEPTTVAMAVKEKQSLVFTYEVSFVESHIRWPSRWDAYLKMEGAKFTGSRFSTPSWLLHSSPYSSSDFAPNGSTRFDTVRRIGQGGAGPDE